MAEAGYAAGPCRDARERALRATAGRWSAWVLRSAGACSAQGVQRWHICQVFTAVARDLEQRDHVRLEDAMELWSFIANSRPIFGDQASVESLRPRRNPPRVRPDVPVCRWSRHSPLPRVGVKSQRSRTCAGDTQHAAHVGTLEADHALGLPLGA